MITPEPGELQDLVRQWHQQAQPWTPAGAGTRLHWGAALEQPQTLSTAKLNRLVHHSRGDFTVTVEAGLSLIELQAALAEAKQWLAVDWPWGSGAGGAQSGTIGGLIARGMAGGFRQRYLGIRDQVIGLEVMRADGTQARAGGQVVKNVAGYDLMRLFCGSWGSLGLITQVTLRTFPQQPHRAGLLFTGELKALESMRQACLRADLMPQRLDWSTTEGVPCLLLGLVSISQSAVDAQLQELRSYAQTLGLEANGLNADELQEQEAQGRHAGAELDKERWLMRIGLTPAQAHALMGKACLHGIRLNMAAGSGQGLGWAAPEDLPAHRVSSLSERCRSLGGELTLLQQPSRSGLTSGPEHANHSLVAAIKREFDPLQQLARGRLPGL
ncbi:FAD-binding oxidoreductase [Synechococcus sp. NB0720_010]|uniref:FAD-binding oxidoreductase n=1 Tax=Synechococcus sp. NB0720_010 TaxID=2907159 RepID=UPI001FF9507B|nr:FAD-binding oxidoreductase [Synechococcus sp. NB0720_010]UPH89198.1 FAD-binding oxidoreductase [Synechococcus sp. NB0720_010]